MDFKVYRQTADGAFQLLAETRHREDAMAVYRNWHSAKMTHKGVIIESKNLKGTRGVTTCTTTRP